MVRTRVRKSVTHGQTSAETMKKAVSEVLNGKSIRKTAQDFEISKSTLQRYVTMAKTQGLDTIRLTPAYDHSRIFTDGEEHELASYLIKASKIHHGLTTTATRELAYEFAMKNGKLIPDPWKENKTAGRDWLYHFMQRHTNLAVRTPEATSLSRCTSFNKKNVGDFFTNLQSVMQKYSFAPEAIYNVDETALMTVQKPPRIISERGLKQVGQVTSAERGQHITMCGCINGLGNAIPPFLIFPRVHFKDHMLNGAPTGTRGTSYTSGWMTGEKFEEWMDHFIAHSHCSDDNKVLLLMDNHESHISLSIIDKAKNNGITLLTFPPHCSHKLQPLDRTVYGPLKRYYNASSDAWQLSNPGKSISIYDVAGVLGNAYPRAFTNENIISGFRVTGIYPFDKDIFTEDEYLPSYVTDRVDPTTLDQDSTGNAVTDMTNEATPESEEVPSQDQVPRSENPRATPKKEQQPSASNQLNNTDLPSCSGYFSPEEVRPYPKAEAR